MLNVFGLHLMKLGQKLMKNFKICSVMRIHDAVMQYAPQMS